jgi:NAD(P)-dependent dehydrogenase (short-subunit alcohol dehydrogenase family)
MLVSGANAGLGYHTTQQLAALGATLHMLVRDRQRGESARDAIIEHTGHDRIHLHVVDVSDLRQIRDFAIRFAQDRDRLDVLVNNAGVLLQQRQLSADGIELTFATNVLGPFLLSALLLPALKRSAPSRILHVSSAGMYTQRLDVADLQFERKRYNGAVAYGQTKRAQVMLTEAWAAHLIGSGVNVHAIHPGWAGTTGLQFGLPRFYRLTRPLLRTLAQGADTIVWLAAAARPASSTGKFWFDRLERGTHKLKRTRNTPGDYQRLWDECVRLSGWDETSI